MNKFVCAALVGVSKAVVFEQLLGIDNGDHWRVIFLVGVYHLRIGIAYNKNTLQSLDEQNIKVIIQ